MAKNSTLGAKHAQVSNTGSAYVPRTIKGNGDPYNTNSGNGGKGLRKSRRNSGVLILIGVVVAVIVVAYFVGVIVFSGHFYPNTVIAGEDASMKTPGEVSDLLDDMIGSYSTEVVGHGVDMTLSAEEMGLTLDSEAVTEGMMDKRNPWAWPVEVFGRHDETSALETTYQESDKLSEMVNSTVDEFNETATLPVDATISYDEGMDVFTVVPSKIGTALNAAAITDDIITATMALEPEVDLGDEVLQQPRIYEDNPSLLGALDEANAMIRVNLVADMASTQVAETTPALIASWIRVETPEEAAEEASDEGDEEQPEKEDVEEAADIGDEHTAIEEAYADEPEEDSDVPVVSAVLDGEAVYSWALDVTSNCDTVGSTRTYTRPDGAEITVSGGTYGWYTDTAAFRDLIVDAVSSHESGTIDIPTTSTAAVYDGLGNRDWGSLYIDIDISAQYVRFYDGDTIIWESSCVSGLPANGRATPTGVFYINWPYVGRNVTLRGYESDGVTVDYESDVSYWMPFYGNSVGLHDASWRSSFGGSIYQSNGSHGCVNLPSGNAANLYEIITGTYDQESIPVVVHY